MDKNKIKEVSYMYEKFLKDKGCVSKKYDSETKLIQPSEQEALSHILYMIEEIKKFIKENRVEKAFRWLGFIQGLLWSYGIISLETLKEHNRTYP
jgi:hypothetical protein